ncbi:hypothetical protein C5167_026102 [Papaver somniferum]|nr:hypothetical protein C5167_026102 [Papaver somniferum]
MDYAETNQLVKRRWLVWTDIISENHKRVIPGAASHQKETSNNICNRNVVSAMKLFTPFRWNGVIDIHKQLYKGGDSKLQYGRFSVHLRLISRDLDLLRRIVGCDFLLKGSVDQEFLTLSNDMQLVGLTALLLASKYEDFWHPKLRQELEELQVHSMLHTLRHDGKSKLALSRFSRCIMLVAYGAYLVFQLFSHKHLYEVGLFNAFRIIFFFILWQFWLSL